GADRKAQACAERFWDNYHGGTNRKLLRVTYVGGRVSRLENYTALMQKRVGKVCGYPKLAKRLDALHERFNASEQRRRQELLEKIRARFPCSLNRNSCFRYAPAAGGG